MKFFNPRAMRVPFFLSVVGSADTCLFLERWAGRINRDSTSEPKSTTMTTSGMLRSSLPMTPLPMSRGPKATMVVRTEKITGRPTSMAPSVAALKGGSPSSCLRNIFSPMIMASSTTIPRTMIKAKSDIMFMDTSRCGRIASPVRNDIGMPRVTQKASRMSRKRARRTNTSPRPM